MIDQPHYCGPAMPVSRMKVETAALRAGNVFAEETLGPYA